MWWRLPLCRKISPGVQKGCLLSPSDAGYKQYGMQRSVGVECEALSLPQGLPTAGWGEPYKEWGGWCAVHWDGSLPITDGVQMSWYSGAPDNGAPSPLTI